MHANTKGVCAGILRATLWVLLCCSVSAGAQNKPRPKSQPPVECRVQLGVVEQNEHKLTVRVRSNCPVTREQLKTALLDVKSSAFAAGAKPGELRVDLGRILEHPWLSTAFARAALNSKEWDKAQGKPRQRNINQFANALLRISGALEDLVPGWTLQGVSTEKVLVQPARNLPELAAAPGDKALVPYDAQLWLIYAAGTAGTVQAPGAAPTVVPPARLDDE